MSKRGHEDEDALLDAEMGDFKEYVPLKHRRMDQVRPRFGCANSSRWCKLCIFLGERERERDARVGREDGGWYGTDGTQKPRSTMQLHPHAHAPAYGCVAIA